MMYKELETAAKELMRDSEQLVDSDEMLVMRSEVLELIARAREVDNWKTESQRHYDDARKYLAVADQLAAALRFHSETSTVLAIYDALERGA